MTDDLSFNNNLRVGKRKLHVQTTFLSDARRITSSIFDGGQLIDKREMIVDEGIASKQVEKEVRNFHQWVVSDIEVLFSISKKVQESRHVASIKKLGQLFFEKGFYDEAIQQFNFALKVDPGAENCHYSIGQAFYKKGAYAAALEKLLVAAEKKPEYPDLHFLLAKTHWEMGHHVLAIRELEHAVALNEVYNQAFFTLALYLLKTTITDPKNPELLPPIERIKQAKKYFQKALRLSPDYDRDLMASGFEKLEERDRIGEAIQDFENADIEQTRLHKNIFTDSEFYLKFMFAGLDKDGKSLAHYIRILEKTISTHPNYADLHKSLGSAYLIESWQYFIKAIEEFRQAVKINPDFEKAQKGLRLLENDSRGFLILLRSILK